MKTMKDVELMNKYENEILALIENQMSTNGRDLPWSDVQGRVGAIVMNLISEVKAAHKVCALCTTATDLVPGGNVCRSCSDGIPF